MNKINSKGFSLPLAMGLIIVISLLAITILEYIIPFSRDIKGVENSSKAYYQADSGIEDGLYYIYERNSSGFIDNTNEDLNQLTVSATVDYGYSTSSSGIVLPPLLEGNSEYDNNWNIISSGNPIQLMIGEGGITSDLKIAFRVPDLDGSGLSPIIETLSGGTLAVVNWQLSSGNDTLNSSGSIIKASDVLDSDQVFTDNTFYLWNYQGINLAGEETNDEIFSNFYNNNCGNSGSGCTLKFSVINKLETSDFGNSIIIPYLEWKLELDISNTKNIPLRYTKLQSSGKSYGYKKDLNIKIPSQTVNEAFDFTIFQ